MYWRGIKIIICLFILSTLTFGMTADIKKLDDKRIEIYWKKLKEKADRTWSGMDMNLDLEINKDSTGDESLGAKITVPFLGKEKKRKKEKEKRDFLNKGADYLENLQYNIDKIQILREKERILRTIMTEQGVTSVEAYHEAKEDRVKLESEVDSIVRKLEAMLR